MFSQQEVASWLETAWFAHDEQAARASRVGLRFDQHVDLEGASARRLRKFVDTVLVSAPGWPDDDLSHHLAKRAAEAAETLAALPGLPINSERVRFQSALLHELAGQPMMAKAVVEQDEQAFGHRFMRAMFERDGPFGLLGQPVSEPGDVPSETNAMMLLALCQDAYELAEAQQGENGHGLLSDARALRDAAGAFSLDLGLTEVTAFQHVIRRRAIRATRLHIPPDLLDAAAAAQTPVELWPLQVQLLDQGLLTDQTSWGVAAPTGTGKSFLARLIVLGALGASPGKKALYIVPANALVYEVASRLGEAFDDLDYEVTAVTPQLVALDEAEDSALQEADVLVLTPEKADLLLRIGAPILADVSLVIVDEAHHLENQTRGVLLELYLTRLKAHFAEQARYVLLSAVAPNIGQLTTWVDPGAKSRLFTERATRMSVGVYRVRRDGRRNAGFIDYVSGPSVRVVNERVAGSGRKRLAQLARALEPGGPVLVVARGKGTTESLAHVLQKQILETGHDAQLSEEDWESDVMQRLDARLEREMYSAVPLRGLIRNRIAYHHAGLPPRVRESLEDAITARHIRYVIATTTLGEGVNFPFSSVVVQSIGIREPPEYGKPASWRLVTPRTFWNIAGRAGRPGYDHEGQVILFEESLALDKVEAVIDPYLDSSIENIPPVRSALATALRDIRTSLAEGDYDVSALDAVELDPDLPRQVQGMVNLVRVGIAHARASGMEDAAQELFSMTLASQTLDQQGDEFARQLFSRQTEVVDNFLSSDDSPTARLIAELGLSLDTLSRLRGYVRGLDNSRLEGFANVTFGGRINFGALKYLVSPVLARMAELEGRRLQSIYTDLVVDWCQGKPFASIPLLASQTKREELITLMYSSIGYMLPWGLYAFDRFVAEECDRRHLDYGHEVQTVAYLVDGGVPDTHALHLVGHGFERTDAARIAKAYLNDAVARDSTDIARWVRAQPLDRLQRIVRGVDNRRQDFDLQRLVRRLAEAPRHDGSE